MVSDIRFKLIDIYNQLKRPVIKEADFQNINAALLKCLEQIKQLNFEKYECRIPNVLKTINSNINAKRIPDNKNRKTLLETVTRLSKSIIARNCAVPEDPRCNLTGTQKNNFTQFFNLFLNNDMIEKTDSESGVPIESDLGSQILTYLETKGNYRAQENSLNDHLIDEDNRPVHLNLLAIETLSHVHRLAVMMVKPFTLTLAAPKQMLTGFTTAIQEELANYGNDNRLPYPVIMEIDSATERVVKTGKYSHLMFMTRDLYSKKLITLDQCLDMKMIIRDCLLAEVEKLIVSQMEKAQRLEKSSEPLPDTSQLSFDEETMHLTLRGDRDSLRAFFVPGLYPTIKKELIDATILRDCDTPHRVRLFRLRIKNEQIEELWQSIPLSLPPTRTSIEIDDNFFNRPNGYYLLPLHTHQPESLLQRDENDPNGFTCNIKALDEMGWNRLFYEFPTLSKILHINPNILSLCEPALPPPMARPMPVLVRGIRREVGFSEQLVEEGLSGIKDSILDHIFTIDTPPVNLILYASSVWRANAHQGKDFYDHQDLQYMLCANVSSFLMVKNRHKDGAAPTVYTDKETSGVYNNSFHMGYALQLLAARLTGINLTMVLRERDEPLYRDHCSTVENVINTMMNGGNDVDNILKRLVKYQETPLNTLEHIDGRDWRPVILRN